MAVIAVLGWGSLVHQPAGASTLNQEALRLRGPWSLAGPTLPVEFSRISNGNRLTLVIDSQDGVCCATYIAESAAEDVDAAAENLRQREGKPLREHIGKLSRGENPTTGYRSIIAEWLAVSRFDSVVWTALPANFLGKQKVPFSVEAGVRFLDDRTGIERERAHRYIINAPDEIRTPLRQAARWPEAVSVHEAGHFVVSCIAGRDVIRLSRIPVDDRPGFPPTVGCRYQPDDHADIATVIACAVAGAWAQVVCMPESIADRKLAKFTTGIVRPRPEWGLYDWTWWVEDMKDILPLAEMSLGEIATNAVIGENVCRFDRQVGALIHRPDAQAAIALVRDELMRSPNLVGDSLRLLRDQVKAALAPDARAELFG